MATPRASLSEQLFLAKTKGSRVGTVRGHNVNADINGMVTIVTLDGDEPVGHVISLTPPVRQGQVIVPALSVAATEVDTGTLTVDIGTSSNPASIAEGVEVGAEGVVNLGAKFTDLDTVDVGEDIIATVTAATGLVAGATIAVYFVTRSV